MIYHRRVKSTWLVRATLSLSFAALFGCHAPSPTPATPVTQVELEPKLDPVPVIVTRDPDPPRRTAVVASRGRFDFVGTWKAPDGSIWRLSDTDFYLRFPHDGGTRENFGHIVEIDQPHGHFIIVYDKSLQDGRQVSVPDEHGYVTYVIEGDTIRKWVSGSLPYVDASDERFTRVSGEP